MARLRTIPKAAAELGLATQTLHRWRKDGKIQAERDGLAHWIIDLDKIPRELIDQAHVQSQWRWAPGETTIPRSPLPSRHDAESENAFLREQLARALEMIDRLSGGKPPTEG